MQNGAITGLITALVKIQIFFTLKSILNIIKLQELREFMLSEDHFQPCSFLPGYA